MTKVFLFFFVLISTVTVCQEVDNSKVIQQKLNELSSEIIELVQLNRLPVEDGEIIETFTDNRISKITNSFFIGNQSYIYDFQLFEQKVAGGNSRSNLIDVILDNFVTDLVSVNRLEFSEVKESAYWSKCDYVYECNFSLIVTPIIGDEDYVESGSLYIVINDDFRFKGIFNQTEPNLKFTLPDANCDEEIVTGESTIENSPDEDNTVIEAIDSDRDGVIDSLDKCPNQPGAGGDGCPEKIVIGSRNKDTDGDGVVDRRDKCPQKFGTGKDGCPEKVIIGPDPAKEDSDGDGIVDVLDRCPKKYGPISNDGCPKSKPQKKSPTPKLVKVDRIKAFPYNDEDNDKVRNKDDKCPYERGFIKYSGCPYPLKFYFSNAVNFSFYIGFTGMKHPKTRIVTENNGENGYSFDSERSISFFESDDVNSYPLEFGFSMDYLLKKNGNLKHGFRGGIAYSMYTFRYTDSTNPPSIDPEFVANTSAHPKFVSLSLGYLLGFSPMYDFSGKIHKRNLVTLNIGANYKYQYDEESEFDFIQEYPIYGFFHGRIYLFYINFEYPINDFIKPRIIADNSVFTPFILSFGMEVPF